MPEERESRPSLVLTVDVEPDWGMSGHQAVEQVLPVLLDLLDDCCAEATFFVATDVLDHCRAPLRAAAARHEIASHGVSHCRLDLLPAAQVQRELRESRHRLSVELDTDIAGFRAPFLKVPPRWTQFLAEAGYRYDSSRGSVWPSPVNVPPWQWKAVRRHGIAELPTTTLATGCVPLSLTYLRLLAPAGEWLVPRTGGVLYLHPHELADPSLARVLRAPLRWALRRNAGPPAWAILRRLLERWPGRVVSCRTWLDANIPMPEGA